MIMRSMLAAVTFIALSVPANAQPYRSNNPYPQPQYQAPDTRVANSTPQMYQPMPRQPNYARPLAQNAAREAFYRTAPNIRSVPGANFIRPSVPGMVIGLWATPNTAYAPAPGDPITQVPPHATTSRRGR
ncbi:MAG: hypothetical protein ABL907_08520 [Hyphomicrobium sp.]